MRKIIAMLRGSEGVTEGGVIAYGARYYSEEWCGQWGDCVV